MNGVLFEEIGDPTARRDHDFYETPSWMTRALLKRIRPAGRAIEPCAGHGAISRLLCDARLTTVVNEPYEDFQFTLEHTTWAKVFRLDATRRESWEQFPAVDWVITNPPFDLSHLIVPLAYEYARVGVAMLLRLSWFEPTDDERARAPFLEAHPPDAVITMPRHNFRGTSSTDSVTSAWFIWAKYSPKPHNDVVTKRERDELIALERQR